MAISWTGVLDCTERGPRSSLANAVVVLQTDPAWSSAVFWYDEFLDRVLLQSPTGVREWRDDDDTRVCLHLQQVVQMATVAETIASSAVRFVAKQRPRHCVRDYLTALEWDRRPRIATAFADFWGAPVNDQQPADYLAAISANFFLGMIARVLKPGCQLDTMVIFEGPQGVGKSRALRALGGDWYMLASESVTHKDFFQSFPGKLVIEIGEMDSFSRAERERVKLAISTPMDRYRSSYGRRAEDHPRQCAFAGTTNRDDYGNDDTGLRRFLPVLCGAIDVAGLTAQRDQLFAEAHQRIAAGEPWWLTPAAPTLQVQRDRQHDDVWTADVLDWVIGQADVTSAEVLRGALKIRSGDMDRSAQMRVSSILKLAGWKRQTVRRDGKPIKAFQRPDVDDDGNAAF